MKWAHKFDGAGEAGCACALDIPQQQYEHRLRTNILSGSERALRLCYTKRSKPTFICLIQIKNTNILENPNIA